MADALPDVETNTASGATETGQLPASPGREELKKIHEARGAALRQAGKGDHLKPVDDAADTHSTKSSPSPAHTYSAPRNWHDRFMPPFSFQTLGDAFASSFFFGRWFMYQFEVTYDYIREQLGDWHIRNDRYPDGKYYPIRAAAQKMREWVKEFAGRLPGKEVEIKKPGWAEEAMPRDNKYYVGRPEIPKKEIASREMVFVQQSIAEHKGRLSSLPVGDPDVGKIEYKLQSMGKRLETLRMARVKAEVAGREIAVLQKQITQRTKQLSALPVGHPQLSRMEYKLHSLHGRLESLKAVKAAGGKISALELAYDNMIKLEHSIVENEALLGTLGTGHPNVQSTHALLGDLSESLNQAKAAFAKIQNPEITVKPDKIVRRLMRTEYIDVVTKIVRPVKPGWKKTLLGIFPFTRDVRGMRPLEEGAKPGIDPATKDYFRQKPVPGWDRYSRDGQGEGYYFARNLTNLLEAVVFGAMDMIGYRSYRREMIRDLSDTIQLDKGTAKKAVHKHDLTRSKNPFIQSELSQNRLKYTLRFVGDAAFMWGLKTGILLKLLPYPLEYTVFREKTAFRNLKVALKDVRVNYLGPEIEPSFTMNLQRCVEQCLHDHRRPLLKGEALERYKHEVLQPIAKLTVAGHLSLGEIIHVLGDVLSPDKRQQLARKKLEALAAAKNIPLETTKTSDAIPSADAPHQNHSPPIPPPSKKRDEVLSRGPNSFLSAASADMSDQPLPMPSR